MSMQFSPGQHVWITTKDGEKSATFKEAKGDIAACEVLVLVHIKGAIYQQQFRAIEVPISDVHERPQ